VTRPGPDEIPAGRREKGIFAGMEQGHAGADGETFGIERGYWDAMGHWHDTSDEVRKTLLAAMKADAPSPASSTRPIAPGQPLPWEGPAEVRLEDGTTLKLTGGAPSDLPLGIHQASPVQGEPLQLIVSPAQCPAPRSAKSWGWALQLYSLRSTRSWGIGDFADLRRIAAWSARLGAGFLQINPLGSSKPGLPQEASPYYPCSRRFMNPLYLRIEEIPGADEAGARIEELAVAGRALNRSPLIDRDAVYKLKMEALETLWARGGSREGYPAFVAERGRELREYAVYCALAEVHGGDWRRWPEGYRHPAAPAVARFAEQARDRVEFHQWVQWLLDEQMAKAGLAIPLILDLPIGFDPTGADGWAWQDIVALDAAVGAPPDEFNTKGQNWGLPPFIPHKLRACGYEPLRLTLRGILRHAGGLRVDHVMGLFRLYWIPNGSDASKGAYVRYPAEEMLAILALEAARGARGKGSFVVGEDLGTVEPRVREAMTARRIHSSRVFWFEPGPPAGYAESALASISTHDLPTLAGMWSGRDLAEQHELGLAPNVEGAKQSLDRLKWFAGLRGDEPVTEMVLRAHQTLAQAPCALLSASLEDALAMELRPNQPGTTSERPNWRIPLALPLEQIEADPLVLSVAKALSR
jgi:4-alpha-glucanotransferase